jgi:hypothetical protein
VLPSEPLTVTPVALVAVTVRVEEPPAVIEVGLAVIVTVGIGGGVTPGVDTARVMLAVVWPSRPLAVAVYDVVVLGLTD